MLRGKCVKTLSKALSTRAPTLNPITYLTEEETLIQKNVATFSREILKPRVLEMDKQGFIDSQVLKEGFKNGIFSIEISEDMGGCGASFFASILAIEQISMVDCSFSVVCDVQNTLIITLLKKYASSKLKDKYFPRLAKDTIGSFCLSETNSGSDAFSLQTKAQETPNGDFVLNGAKMWITNASIAGMFVVFATINPELGYRGISCFLVDGNSEGLSVGPPEDKLGLRASGTCPVYFDNVLVPRDHVIGELGKGYKYAIDILNEGRIAIGAQMVGLAEGCLGIALEYAKDRKQFNQSILDFQAVQHCIAQMETQISAGRLLVYNTARELMNGVSVVKNAAITKYFTSEMAGRVASQSVDLMGGMGYIKDSLVEKFYRDVKIGTIYEGTSNIQLNTIAKCMLADRGLISS